MSDPGTSVNTKKLALLAASLGLFYVLVRHKSSILGSLRRKVQFWRPLSLQHKRIEVISSINDSQRILNELKK